MCLYLLGLVCVHFCSFVSPQEVCIFCIVSNNSLHTKLHGVTVYVSGFINFYMQQHGMKWDKMQICAMIVIASPHSSQANFAFHSIFQFQTLHLNANNLFQFFFLGDLIKSSPRNIFFFFIETCNRSTSIFNRCSRPILHADDGPWNWSETFVLIKVWLSPLNLTYEFVVTNHHMDLA